MRILELCPELCSGRSAPHFPAARADRLTTLCIDDSSALQARAGVLNVLLHNISLFIRASAEEQKKTHIMSCSRRVFRCVTLAN